MTNPVPASFVRRALAFVIDILPIAGGLSVLSIYFFGFGDVIAEVTARPGDPAARSQYMAMLFRVLSYSLTLWVIYCAFADAGERQGTIGKKILGLKVADRAGDRLMLQQSLRRNSVKFLSFLPLGLGFWWALLPPARKTWHDLLSQTIVMRAVPVSPSRSVETEATTSLPR
jgi:uncharacterized RDD family membrane protein YckC